MTYTFKLSRRLARLRDVSLVVAAVFTISCTSDESTGPESVPLTDPNGISVSPDSVLMTPNQAVQFISSTLESGALSTSLRKGRGKGWRTVVGLRVAPETLTVAGGSAANFVATGSLSDGSSVEPSVTWRATGGTIDANGKYTAGPIAGAYAVSAVASNGIADTAAVIVTQSPPSIVAVSLSPASVSLPEGGSKRFVAMGKSNDGSSVAVGAKYAATGGTISGDGLYQAGQTPGTFRVVATDTVTNLADTAAVIIEPPPATLQAVVLSPSTVSLAAGGTQRFTVTGKMSDGSTSSVTVSWSATGGGITDGMYTAGTTAGTFRVIATQQGGTLADTSSVTITPPAPAPSPPQAGDLPTPLRTVNVATTAALQAAWQNALPGDRIVLAPGSYNVGGFYNVPLRSGTAQNPIVTTGPRTAVITGGLVINASYLIFNGFRLTGGQKGIYHVGGNYNIYEYLEVDHTEGEAIAIKTGFPGVNNGTTVTGNVIRYTNIHDTGTARADYGEGIYIGDGTCNCQVVTNTHIHHNTVGPNIGAESIELKHPVSGSLVEFNTINGGMGMVIRGNSNVINDNTLTGLGPDDGRGANGNALIGVGTSIAGTVASNNIFRRNTGSNEKFLFYVDATASGTQVFCDNKALTGTLGVSCIP